MKKSITVIVVASVLMLFACNQAGENSTPKAHAWAFTVTPQTTMHNIDSVAMAWRKDSIELKFSMLQYTDDGKLAVASGSVNFMKKGNLPSAKFVQDSICRKSLVINLDDRPSVSISDK